MKKLTLLIVMLAALTAGATAQVLTQEKTSQLWGYKNADGSWKIRPVYQKAQAFQGGARKFAVVKYDHYWGCIDVMGEMVVRNIFHTPEEAERAGQEWQGNDEPGKWVYPTRNPVDGKWGFVNYYGQWKFQPIYQEARDFIGTEPMKFATVKLDDRWGCIDGKGIMIINNIFMAQEQAEEAGRQWIVGTHYHTWRYPVTNPKTNLWGFVNYLGRWVVQPQYEDHDFFGGDNHYLYTQVKRIGRWGNIDRDGNIVSECIFDSKEDAAYALLQLEKGRPLDGWRFPVSHPNTNLWGWVNYKGEFVIDPIYQAATHFANDTGEFATARKNGFWGSIESDGYPLSNFVFTLTSEAQKAGNEWDTKQELGHWLYPVRDTVSGHWGYVNFRGQWVINPLFEDAKLFIKTWNNRIAPAQMDGKWGCIDHTGQFVVTNQYSTSADAYAEGRKWAEKRKF